MPVNYENLPEITVSIFYNLTDAKCNELITKTGKKITKKQSISFFLSSLPEITRASLLSLHRSTLEDIRSSENKSTTICFMQELSDIITDATLCSAIYAEVSYIKNNTITDLTNKIVKYIDSVHECMGKGYVGKYYHPAELTEEELTKARSLGVTLTNYLEYQERLKIFIKAHENKLIEEEEQRALREVKEQALMKDLEEKRYAAAIEWINSFGSVYLKNLLKCGYSVKTRYTIERMEREYPGFSCLSHMGKGKYIWDKAVNPSEKSLRLCLGYLGIEEKHPKNEVFIAYESLVDITRGSSDEDEEDDYSNDAYYAVVVRDNNLYHDIYKMCITE